MNKPVSASALFERRDIKPSQRYRSYQGKVFRVLSITLSTDAPRGLDPRRVVYTPDDPECLLGDGPLWDAPYSYFEGVVETADGDVYRFELVE